MILFVLLSLGLTLASLYWLFRGSRAGHGGSAPDRLDINITIAKDKLRRLQARRDQNDISEQEYALLKSEIEQSLADDLNNLPDSNAKADPADSNGLPNKLKLSLLFLVPALAYSIYSITGNPAALSISSESPSTDTPTAMDMQSSLQKLEQHLQQTPDDIAGWTLLARTYSSLGDFEKASNAARQLVRLQGETASNLTNLADALALSKQGDLTGEPSELIRRALQLDAAYPHALWLAGLSALQNNDMQSAREHWTRLEPLLADSPARQQELRALIERTKLSPEELLELREQANVGNAQNTVEPVKTPSSAEVSTPAKLKIHISIAPDLASDNLVNENDTVFVIAKAVNGPPAPLAVKRLTVDQLPAHITLSDEDAMVPQFSLSKFNEVTVSARLSKSGNPIAQAGDISTPQIPVSSRHSELIELTIGSK